MNANNYNSYEAYEKQVELKQLKQYLNFIIGNISSKLVCGFLGKEDGKAVVGRKEAPSVPKFTGGIFTCKIEPDEKMGKIFAKYGYQKIAEYLSQYGIILNADQTVSKTISENEIAQSFKKAEEFSKEFTPTLNEKDSNYAWRKYNEDRHRKNIQYLAEKTSQEKDLTVENVNDFIIGEATKEVQVYDIDAKKKAYKEYFDNIITLFKGGEDEIIISLYSAYYETGKNYYNLPTTSSLETSHDRGYLRLKSLGGNLDDFIKYAEANGLTITKHDQKDLTTLHVVKKDLKKEFDMAKLNQQELDKKELYERLNSLDRSSL